MCGVTASVALRRSAAGEQANQCSSDKNSHAVGHVDGNVTNTQTNGIQGRGEAVNGNKGQETNVSLEDKLYASLEKIAHRGPDARGVWVSEGDAIGQLRLVI
jgi:hypothetical protein